MSQPSEAAKSAAFTLMTSWALWDADGLRGEGFLERVAAFLDSYTPQREQRVAALVAAATAYRKAHKDFDDYTVAVETGDAVYTLSAEAILAQDIDSARDALFVALAPVTPQEPA
jgi:hypothetical protein